ncbi:hypothetical protein [Clostridium perfringens]|uniref:hypothetical protein n=1 Tax=Clostridium perfringens TaxID=1502 RepID=UPI0024BD4000|nr:hypothetical protein [Clostridium perfringens]
MKKNDLENGMIVEIRKGLRFLILDENLIGDDLFNSLNSYDEQMNDKLFNDSDYDIIKVYKFNGRVVLSEIFEDKNLKLIWEKEREIDWSKVSKGIKVIVSDKKEETYHPNELDRIFIGYEPMLEERPFIVKGLLGATSFRYCKIHPSVEIKEEWYK